jgi:hypothetical protein
VKIAIELSKCQDSLRFRITHYNLLRLWLLRHIPFGATGESSEYFTFRRWRHHKFERSHQSVNSLVYGHLEHFLNNALLLAWGLLVTCVTITV